LQADVISGFGEENAGLLGLLLILQKKAVMSIRGLFFGLMVFIAISGGTLFAQESTSDQMLRVGLRESPPFVIVNGDLYSGLSVDYIILETAPRL
jgi:hypothetical protein